VLAGVATTVVESARSEVLEMIDASLFVRAHEQGPKRLPPALGGVEVMVRLTCPVPREADYEAGTHCLGRNSVTCADLI